jgi:hypothetical protein
MRRGAKNRSQRRRICMASISLAAACGVACGGAPFQLGYVGDADVISSDVVSESAADVVDAGRDVQLTLHFDASHDAVVEADAIVEADASIDSSSVDVFDAKKEADVIEVEASPICTPVTPTATICGSNQAVVSAPQAYCWLTGFGGQSTQGEARAMPQGCRCQETYDCGCLLATGISCPSSMALHCNLSNGIVVVSCT